MIKLLLILCGINIIWAGSYVAVKLGLTEMPPLVLVFWRMGIALIILVGWIFVKRIQVRLNKGDLIRVMMIGVVIASAHILWVTGLKYTNASDASLLFAFEPIWSIILASILLREPFKPAMAVGLVLAFIGLVILSDMSLSKIDYLFSASVAFGNILVVIGLMCESLFSIIAKPLSTRCSPIVVVAGGLLVTEIILGFTINVNGNFVFPSTTKCVGSILYLSVLCTVMSYVFWVKVMQDVPVNIMFYTIFVQPITGPIIAMIALGETLDARIFAGGIFILAGMTTAVLSHIIAHRRTSSVSIRTPHIIFENE